MDIRATILGTVIIVFNNRVKQRTKKKETLKKKDDFKLGRVSRRTAAILFSCARVCMRTMKKMLKKGKKGWRGTNEQTSQFLRTLAILRHDHKG